MICNYIRSIRGKILVSILFITLLTSLSVTLIFYRRSARSIEENYVFSLEQRADQLIMSLDTAMERAYHVNVYASCDRRVKENIQLYLEKSGERYLEELSQILYEYKAQSDAISSLYLLIPQASTVVTSEEYPLYRKEISKQKIQEVMCAAKEAASPMLLEDLIYEREMRFSCMESVRDDSGELLGYMISNTDDRKLYYDYLARWNDEAIVESVILDTDQRVITESESSSTGERYREASEYQEWMQGRQTEGSDSQNIYIYCLSIFSEAALLTVVDKSVVLSDLRWIRWFFFGILAVFLAVASMLALYLSHIIYRPLRRLTLTMEEVSDGNLQTRAQVVSRDEIGELAREFNGMLDKIEDLIHRLIEEESKKKDMELEALQYQITPHFMYNTLNSIKFAALLKGEKEIGQVIGDFVELLQAAISKKGTFLTVAEEVHILENYIHLQEFRYGGSFAVTYEVSEGAQECLVPRLILQPLVENALLHGMDMKENTGKLKICALVRETQLLLKVIDNGRGMSREQIEQLLTSKAKKDRGFTAVGIPNIRDRLKLYYGKQGGITYESDEKGTTAIIYLPAKKGEE